MLRSNLRNFRRPREFKGIEQTNQPAFGAINKTPALIAVGGAAGLGGLCLYGLVSGPKTSLSALDQATFWPEQVKNRIRSTYAYLAGSVVVCSATAIQMSRNVAIMSRLAGGGFAAPIAMMIASMGCGIVCRMIPYPEDGSVFNLKHATWLAFSVSVGAMVAPLCLMGGPIITQAALYTGGIVGGLSMVAACAPSDKFLYMGGPLSIGLGVVVVSSLGTMFASPIGRLGMGLHAISLYGGLALFSAFLLYDTQKIVHRAQQPLIIYDPINNSMNVLMDTVNIFVRMVTILSSSKRK